MLAARFLGGGQVGVPAYVVAFGFALVGGAASFTHVHQIRAARHMLRGWRTSWLSREALTTAAFIAALAGEIVWLGVAGSGLGTEIGAIVTALLGLFAMWVTAMLYATIPAMMSWHGPLTVLALTWTGVAAGWITALAIAPGNSWEVPAGVVLLLLWAVFRGLQARMFSAARKRVRGATGAGLPLGPYRLQDTGTTKPPYRTQTQIAPELSGTTRSTALLLAFGWMLAVPVAVLWASRFTAEPRALAIVSAASVTLGCFIDRWLFFRDAVHSSRVWFADPPAIRRPAAEGGRAH